MVHQCFGHASLIVIDVLDRIQYVQIPALQLPLPDARDHAKRRCGCKQSLVFLTSGDTPTLRLPKLVARDRPSLLA